VMYLGRIVELADKETLFTKPLHPYTEALLAAAPVPDPRARREKLIIEGDVPSPINPPKGCHFHTRCPYAEPRCRTLEPRLREIAPNHWAACHLREPGAPPATLKPTKEAPVSLNQASDRFGRREASQDVPTAVARSLR
jgi:oligopeptide/dipeptide ABC transporter ATP-binding protein